MPRFEVTGPDGHRYEVNAPDANAAANAVRGMGGMKPPVQGSIPNVGSFNERYPELGGEAADQWLRSNFLGAPPNPLPAALYRKAEEARHPGGLTGRLERIRDALDVPTRWLEQGITLGGSDELAGVVGGVGSAVRGEGFKPGYDAARGETLAALEQSRREHPFLTGAAELIGGLGTAAAMQRGGASLLNGAKPTYGSMMTRGAAEGALYGGVQGALTGEGGADRLRRAAVGVGVGGAVGAAAGALGARSATKAARADLPDAAALKVQANALYQQADDAGVAISSNSLRQFSRDAGQAIQDAGFDPRIHRNIAAALRRLAKESAGPQSLRQMDVFRQIVRDAGVTDGEKRLAGVLVDKLDDFLTGLQPGDVIAGNSRQGVELLTQARELWSRGKKSELIERLFFNARNAVGANYTQAGMDTAIRQQFRGVAGNPRVWRTFTPDEQQAILKVIRGGPLQNLMRLFGKFAVRGPVTGAIAYGVTGPVAGAAIQGVAEGARLVGNRATAANAGRVADLVRSGGRIPAPTMVPLPRQAITGAATGVLAPRLGDLANSYSTPTRPRR